MMECYAYRPESGLSLDNAVGHTHLPAESRQPQDELNGVHVMRDHHELGLALLHQVRDVVDAVLHHPGRLALHRLALLLCSRGVQKALALGGAVLRAVLEEEFEQAHGCRGEG